MKTPISVKLTRALSPLPITGVSIGRINDKSTWRVDWIGTPTPAEIAQAQAVITAFDPSAPDADEQDFDQRRALLALFTNGAPTAADRDRAIKLLLRRLDND